MIKDWQLLRQLEYQGEYGCRYTCKDCKHFCGNGDYENCSKLNDERVKLSGKNNTCKHFEARIKNPSSPEFNFDDYLEYLYSDYYRPYTINKDEIRGSARIGEVIIDGGRLARMLPDKYSFLYEYYDLPYIRLVNPLTTVKVDNHNFQIEYRLYRKCLWYENNIIKYIKHYWKDKPTQRKYNSEIYGEYEVEENE